MAWTHFKLIEFGVRTTAKVNGILADIGVWYPKTDVLTIDKNNPLHLGEPFDYLKYKVTDGTIESNQADIIVNAAPDVSVMTGSSNQTVSATQNTLYNIIDYIPFTNGVDRIKIVSFDNIGNLELSGFSIYSNFTIMHYDFENITFKTELGTGEPYQKILYQVGNANGMNPTIYELKFDISGVAILNALSESYGTNTNEPVSFDTNFIQNSLEINNGRVNGVANVLMEISLSASAFPAATENAITIAYNSSSLDIQNNITDNISVNLDNNGNAKIFVDGLFNVADSPIVGTITFTLVDVNGDALLVDSGSNQIIYNINI